MGGIPMSYSNVSQKSPDDERYAEDMIDFQVRQG